MPQTHLYLGPHSRRVRRETLSPRRRRGRPPLNSRHHLEETQTAATAPRARRDPGTGRPLHEGVEAVETLSETELQRELTIAALSSSRHARFERLLAEWHRRRPQPRPRWRRALLSLVTPTDWD
jgi:hypothetical protein